MFLRHPDVQSNVWATLPLLALSAVTQSIKKFGTIHRFEFRLTFAEQSVERARAITRVLELKSNAPGAFRHTFTVEHKGHEMRKYTLVIAFAAIAGCLILLSQGSSAQNANTKPQSRKWEYKVVHIAKLVGEAEDLDAIVTGFQKSLNELGNDGWELCLEINGGVVLKRPQ